MTDRTLTRRPSRSALGPDGHAVLPGRFPDAESAWRAAHAVIDEAARHDPLCQVLPLLDTIATYTMPAPGARQRDFQVLHFDFGIPLARAPQADVARYTALYVDADAAPSGAATRLLPLRDLADQRQWPTSPTLAGLLQCRHGDPDAAEGVLTRIIEAADGSVELADKTDPAFLCGLEFDDVAAETAFLAAHGLHLASAERRVVLEPGQVLVFDNLRCAHGRAGIRATGELHQRCLGFRSLTRAQQTTVLHHVLDELTHAPVAVT